MESLDLNSGAIAPVAHESDLFALRVTGTLPADLDGAPLEASPALRCRLVEGQGCLADAFAPSESAVSTPMVCRYVDRWEYTTPLGLPVVPDV